MALNKAGALIMTSDKDEEAEDNEKPLIIVNGKAETQKKTLVKKVVKVVKAAPPKKEEAKTVAAAAPVVKAEYKEPAAPKKKITEPSPVPRSTVLLKDQPVSVRSVSEESIFSAANASHPGKAFIKRRII